MIGTDAALSRMSDEKLRLRWSSMLPERYAIAELKSLLDLLMPVIRADILAYESCADVCMRVSRTPLLAVAGGMDAMAPLSSMREWEKMGPSAEVVAIDEAGHLFVLSHAEALARLIVSFVGKQTAKRQCVDHAFGRSSINEYED
jgi:surfactin synthase thioesterase subunit